MLRIWEKSFTMTNLWKYFWLHTRKSWKIHVVFMMVSVGFWPLGSKNYPELREDGGWPDPALRCEITPGSHVFLLSLFTLRFQKSRQLACNGPTDLLRATSLVQMQPLIFFFVVLLQAQLRRWESLCVIIARSCSGTEPHGCLLFQIWRTFGGIISCSFLG